MKLPALIMIGNIECDDNVELTQEFIEAVKAYDGFVNIPIVEATGMCDGYPTYRLVQGSKELQAAKALGWTLIPAMVIGAYYDRVVIPKDKREADKSAAYAQLNIYDGVMIV